MRALSIVALTLAVGACKKSQEAATETTPQVASAAPASQPASALLSVGAPAPAIESVAHNGQKVSLSELKGRPVVVYFYPKDDTPGCTVEAEGIRDDWADLSKANAVVLGVSTQDNASHRAFASKYGLPFMLLPDSDESIAKAFGVPVKNGYTKRVTFVIDKQGKIAKVFPEVNPKGHSDEILEALRELG
jgi:thioredoxin-dependent peroxiredoxin